MLQFILIWIVFILVFPIIYLILKKDINKKASSPPNGSVWSSVVNYLFNGIYKNEMSVSKLAFTIAIIVLYFSVVGIVLFVILNLYPILGF